MKLRILAQQNPEYRFRMWREIDDFYQGGYDLQKRAHHYLPKLVNEKDELYSERIKLASYINYLGSITDFFVANLFSQELVVQPASDAKDKNTLGTEPFPDQFYEVFSADADRQGNSLAKVMRGCFLTALLKKRALITIDFPSQAEVETQPINRAEEEALGTS